MNGLDKALTGSSSLAGRVAVITGGARGIGRSIAELFQQHGASVCIVDVDREAGMATAAQLTAGSPANPVVCLVADIASQSEVHGVFLEVAARFGRVDILVNNAGIEIERSFADTTPEIWDCVLSVNLRAPLFLAQALLPCFPPEGGAVVNISSIHATHAFPGSISYACSKAGLVALTRNMALELAARKIRVNVICPGYIDTRLWDTYIQNSPDGDTLAAQVSALHPLGRRGMPEDVAQAALFLASPAAAFITGSHLVVDGGLTVRAHP